MSEQMETANAETTVVVEDLWESAETEALSEFDGDEAVTEEAVEPEEPVAEEAEAEAPVEAEGEVEAVDDSPEESPDEEVEMAPVTEWDGNPETLHPALKRQSQQQVQGVNKKLEELAVIRKEYEAKLEALNASKEEAVPEGPPELPTGDDVSAEEWNKAQDARQAWFAKDAVRKELEAKSKITAEKDAVTQSHADAQARFESLQQADGFTDEVAMAMAQVAENDKTGYWAEQLRTSDPGTKALFQLVKHELAAQAAANKQKTEAAAKADEVVRAKASAGKRGLSRPSAKSKSPQQIYANSFEKAEAEAMDEFDKL